MDAVVAGAGNGGILRNSARGDIEAYVDSVTVCTIGIRGKPQLALASSSGGKYFLFRYFKLICSLLNTNSLSRRYVFERMQWHMSC